MMFKLTRLNRPMNRKVKKTVKYNLASLPCRHRMERNTPPKERQRVRQLEKNGVTWAPATTLRLNWKVTNGCLLNRETTLRTKLVIAYRSRKNHANPHKVNRTHFPKIQNITKKTIPPIPSMTSPRILRAMKKKPTSVESVVIVSKDSP